MDKWLTTQQAAEKLHMTDSRVRQLILEGRLPAQKFGHLHMIREEDLPLVAGIKRGRPPKVEAAKAQAAKKKGK